MNDTKVSVFKLKVARTDHLIRREQYTRKPSNYAIMPLEDASMDVLHSPFHGIIHLQRVVL